MEVVDFYPKTFKEIPEQDNPAFWKDECVMVVRENNSRERSIRSTVLHINRKGNPGDAVTQIAIFWKYGRAMMFAKTFKPIESECIECGAEFNPVTGDKCQYCGNINPF